VLEVRPSKSQADRGLIRVRKTTFNQSGEQVQMYVGNLLVPRWSSAG
jgi:acyl dehydratase